MQTEIGLGDRVRWESAAGTLRGEIVKMELAMNAANKRIPWIVIERIQNNKVVLDRLAGTSDNLAMMKLKVIFRDVEGM